MYVYLNIILYLYDVRHKVLYVYNFRIEYNESTYSGAGASGAYYTFIVFCLNLSLYNI